MFVSLSKNIVRCRPLVRAFARKPDIPTKYNVLTIPCLKDNFCYVLSTMDTKKCVVIDPTVPTFIEDAISMGGFELKALFSTHHHIKHVLGMGEVLSKHPSIPVYGGYHPDTNPAVERILKDGDEVQCDEFSFKVIGAPSHSSDSLIYEFTEENGYPFLFTGDSVNMGGVGYVLEDQIDSLYHLIYDVLMNYPDETCLFHGHENAEQMLKFGRTIEPSNRDIKNLHWAVKRTLLKAKNKPGTPTCLHDEKLVNPFFRVFEPTVQATLGESDPKKAFAELVRRRNAYFKKRWMKWRVCLILYGVVWCGELLLENHILWNGMIRVLLVHEH